jgi:hypothetical protein
MRSRGSKSGVKNETPKSPETRESLGKIGIFLLLKSDFPHAKINFLQRLSNFLPQLSPFFDGFPIFFNGFPIFFNGFLLSSLAFRCPRIPRKSFYGIKCTKYHYLSFVFPTTRSPSFVIPTN